MKEKQSEKWYAILGIQCGICSVHASRAEANKEHRQKKYTKKNRIVRVIITY